MADSGTQVYGARIRTRRAQLDLSTKHVASACGVVEGTIRNIESGRANPSLRLAFRIARVLNIDPAQIIVGNGGVPSEPPPQPKPRPKEPRREPKDQKGPRRGEMRRAS